MGAELCDEAARVIQRWWRSGSCVSSLAAGSSADVSDDDGSAELNTEEENPHSVDDNGPENLAVRRAFLASISVARPNNKADGSEEAQWTMEQVSSWMDSTLEFTLAPAERAAGARVFWREWGAIEKFFPHNLRTGTIQMFDNKMQSIGFPSLRELVRLQDGG